MKPEKRGFNGQWVDIFSTGIHIDDEGNKHVIDVSFLESVSQNLQLDLHEAPAVVGHPKADAPAYGWVCDLRVERHKDDGLLQAQFCDTDPNFEELVRHGRYKKRSASFYMDARTAPGGRVPALRHVGFLGAKPPAVKGLRNVEFSEGEAITFEDINFSEGDSSMDKDEKEVQSLVEKAWEGLKKKLGIGADAERGSQASFSESDVKRIAEEAAQAATSSFAEENKTLRTQLEELSKKVSQQSGLTTRAEIISFCDSLGKSNCPPAFRHMGIVEFMETLATVDDKTKVSVISFEEKDGAKKEVKTESTPLVWFKNFLNGIGPVIQFGEQFGVLRDTGTGADLVDPEAMNKMREGMGIKKPEGGGK